MPRRCECDRGKFAEYDVPFSFSKYRHWQRGLVKMKGAKSVLRLLTLMREGDDGALERRVQVRIEK